MKKKILFILTLASTFMFSAGMAYAAHYISGVSSVDEREIRWGGSTTYATQWNAGIATWNALRKINIAPDTVWTYEDLKVSDVDAANGWTGLWTYSRWSTDSLKLNKYYLKNSTNAQRQNTATHEFGHALGLAHSISGNILYYAQTSQTSLGSQDRYDYGYLWGY